MSQVRITTNATSTEGGIEIDGQDVANFARGFELRAGVGEITTLTLDLIPRRVSEFEGEAFVRLRGEFEDFLIALGWTPPRRP